MEEVLLFGFVMQDLNQIIYVIVHQDSFAKPFDGFRSCLCLISPSTAPLPFHQERGNLYSPYCSLKPSLSSSQPPTPTPTPASTLDGITSLFW